MEKQIEANEELIAFCGLYCGACPQYLKNICPSCRKHERATWCKVRTCCISNNLSSCADCSTNVLECKKFTNFISKVFSFFFNSDRRACIERIKTIGRAEYAKEMTEKRVHSIKRR